jgi:signal transduction histidine kinase
VIRRPAQACAALAGALALFALLAWTAGDWRIAACGAKFVPMAPSTALAILLLSCAIFVHHCRPSARFARAGVHAAVFGATALGLLVQMQTRFGRELPIEGWLSGATEQMGGVPLGRMSPLTASTLVLCALAFWLAAPPLGRRWPCRQAASVVTLAVLVIGVVVLLSYAAGVPLLYGTPTIPMALLTAVAFALLAAAILGGTGSDTFPLCLFQPPPEADSRPSRGWLVGGPLLIFSFLAAGIGAVGYCYFMHQVSASREAAEKELLAGADMKVRQVSAWYAERMRDAGFFSETPRLAELAGDCAADPPTAKGRDQMLAWMTSVRKSFHYGRVLLVDRDQRVRLAVPSDKDWLGPTAQSFAARTLATGRIQVSDLHRSRMVPGTIDMDVFVPLLPETAEADARPEPTGALVFEIDPREFLFPTIQSWPTPSPTAETLLVRREGDAVVYLNELRHKSGTALTLKMPIERADIPAVQAALGRERILEGTDYRDVPVLAVARAVPGTPWFLVAKVDKEEVYAPVRQQGIVTGALVLVLLAVAALGVGFMGRQRDARWLRSQLGVERDYAAVLESANAELEEFNLKAQAATRAKSEFLANMSHEIRTPMTAILGYADLIGEGCPGHCPYGSEEMQPAVAAIRRNGEHLLALINDILDLSKIEAGKFEPSLVRCSPFDVLADVASLMRGRAEAKRLKLETEIAGPMPETILTDPLRLRQILINLTGNAVKFTDRGKVRISAFLVDDGAGPGRGRRPLRRALDGHADARDGRLRGDPHAPPARVRRADPRADRAHHGRRPPKVPRRRL